MIQLNDVHVLRPSQDLGITTQVIEDLASSYAESGHRAPIVLGHPRDNHPAWGWVRGCKVKDDGLYCDMDVTPEFSQMLSEGRFRERSIAYYDSVPPVLRHVGFLGATPPKIKGLEPIQFSDESNDIAVVTQAYSEVSQDPPSKQQKTDMNDYLKPVALYTLSEVLPGLTASNFKTEPVLDGDTITGVVTLSEGVEHNYTLTKSGDNWVAQTEVANPEVIELSEKVSQLQKQIAQMATTGVVEDLYSNHKLTEAILPKADAIRLLAEDSTGLVKKLLNNLPPLVTSTTEALDTPSVKQTMAGFEFAESDVYDQVKVKAQEMGLNINNSDDFVKAYRAL